MASGEVGCSLIAKRDVLTDINHALHQVLPGLGLGVTEGAIQVRVRGLSDADINTILLAAGPEGVHYRLSLRGRENGHARIGVMLA